MKQQLKNVRFSVQKVQIAQKPTHRLEQGSLMAPDQVTSSVSQGEEGEEETPSDSTNITSLLIFFVEYDRRCLLNPPQANKHRTICVGGSRKIHTDQGAVRVFLDASEQRCSKTLFTCCHGYQCTARKSRNHRLRNEASCLCVSLSISRAGLVFCPPPTERISLLVLKIGFPIINQKGEIALFRFVIDLMLTFKQESFSYRLLLYTCLWLQGEI